MSCIWIGVSASVWHMWRCRDVRVWKDCRLKDGEGGRKFVRILWWRDFINLSKLRHSSERAAKQVDPNYWVDVAEILLFDADIFL